MVMFDIIYLLMTCVYAIFELCLCYI